MGRPKNKEPCSAECHHHLLAFRGTRWAADRKAHVQALVHDFGSQGATSNRPKAVAAAHETNSAAGFGRINFAIGIAFVIKIAV